MKDSVKIGAAVIVGAGLIGWLKKKAAGVKGIGDLTAWNKRHLYDFFERTMWGDKVVAYPNYTDERGYIPVDFIYGGYKFAGDACLVSPNNIEYLKDLCRIYNTQYIESKAEPGYPNLYARDISGIGSMQRDWLAVSDDYKPLLITNYGDGEYGKQAKKFADKYGVKLYCLGEDYGYYFPDDDRQRSIYKMKLTRDGKSYTFTFGQSIADTGKFPTYYDIFASLTKNDPYSFEDFCADYGYEQYDDYTGGYNKQSYKTYKAVKKEYEAVNRLFGDVIDELAEIY